MRGLLGRTFGDNMKVLNFLRSYGIYVVILCYGIAVAIHSYVASFHEASAFAGFTMIMIAGFILCVIKILEFVEYRREKKINERAQNNSRHENLERKE